MGNTSTAEYIAGEMIATIIHDSDLLDMNKEKVAHVRAKLAEKLAEPLRKEGAALFTKEFIEDFCIGEDTGVQAILAAHPSLQPVHDMLNEFFEDAGRPAATTQRKADGMTAGEYECQLNTALACVAAFKSVLDAVSEVDDVVGQPGEPCPVASQAAVKRIRRIVQVHVAPLCGKEAPQPDPAKQPEEAKHVAMQETDMLPSVGPAPYCASLVWARNGVLCKDIGEFDSEQDAVEAILLGAARNGLPVDRLCVRHWVTSKNEHIVDFGSHGVYGRIISKLHKG